MEPIFREQAYVVMGACFEVHNHLGAGFLEDVSQQARGRELAIRDVPFVVKPKLPIACKGEVLPACYEPDFVTHDEIIVEPKALRTIDDAHRAQVPDYPKATGMQLGPLPHFGVTPDLPWERIVRTRNHSPHSPDSRLKDHV